MNEEKQMKMRRKEETKPKRYDIQKPQIVRVKAIPARKIGSYDNENEFLNMFFTPRRAKLDFAKCLKSSKIADYVIRKEEDEMTDGFSENENDNSVDVWRQPFGENAFDGFNEEIEIDDDIDLGQFERNGEEYENDFGFNPEPYLTFM